MKVQNNISINNQTNFTGASKLSEKIAKKFAKAGNIGEGTSIACDFLGKAVVVPAVIMLASSEPKENKEFSAFKNPVAAFIQLGLEVPVLMAGSKIVGDLADKGYFDKAKNARKGFSYNEKLQREKFIDTFEKIADKTPKIKEKSKDFLTSIKDGGYTKKAAEDILEILDGADDKIKTAAIKSFKNFEHAHENKFHLQNRICFVAALLLTPFLCAIENYIHPKIMNKIYEKRAAKNPSKMVKMPNIETFLNHAKGAVPTQNKQGGALWYKKLLQALQILPLLKIIL